LASPFNVVRSVVMLGFLVLVLVWVAGRREPAASFVPRTMSGRILLIVIPVLILLASLAQAFYRDFAVWLVRDENRGLNYRHAIFVKAAMELAACVIFVTLLVTFIRRKVPWAALACALLAFVTFAMVGEELSWGQRIFNWATPGVFAQINDQRETNFHNMATELFQNVWYFAGWLLLVAIPFFRAAISAGLARVKKFSFLLDFLPPAWFVLVFAPAYALVDPIKSPMGLRYGSILFSILGAAAFLIYLTIAGRGRLVATWWSLAVFAVSLYVELFMSLSWDSNQGVPTEYLEVFIAFGTLYWAAVVRKQVTASDRLRNGAAGPAIDVAAA